MLTKAKKVIGRGEKSKTLNEAKPVQNINKNSQSFLHIVLYKRNSFLYINCKTMHLSERIVSDSRKIALQREIARRVESSKFVLHKARILGELDSRKDSDLAKLEQSR